MIEIIVNKNTTIDGYVFTVEVKEDSSSTKHEVTMSKPDYTRLTQGKCSAEEFVRKAFEFLLEHEPKESILSSFDISIISDYFPEFEEEMGKRI